MNVITLKKNYINRHLICQLSHYMYYMFGREKRIKLVEREMQMRAQFIKEMGKIGVKTFLKMDL